MKIIFNFIVSVFLIEVGFFLIFGNDMNYNNSYKNLTNYQDSNLPPEGTEVELYIVDIGELFLKNDNITNLVYESECYYIAQINDGRFIVIKTEEGSKTDKKVSEYSEQCENYYKLHKGEKPEILCLDGIIESAPFLESGSFSDFLDKAKKIMMPTRGYIRMEVNNIIVNTDYKVGSSMDSVLKQSVDVMISAANVLKKFLGFVVIFMGLILIISFIKDILDGVTINTESKDVIVVGDDVFGNISTIKSDWRKDADKAEFEYQKNNKPMKIDGKKLNSKDSQKENEKPIEKTNVNEKPNEKNVDKKKGFKLKN